MFKKIFSIVLVLAICMPLFAACNDPADDVKPPQVVELTAEGLADYKIVYLADGEDTSEKAAAEKISAAIASSLSVTLPVEANATVAEDGKAIIIYAAESVTASKDKAYLRVKDCAVAVENAKINVVAGSNEALDFAADNFISKLSASTVLEQGVTVVEGTYPAGYVNIDGIALERYDIVYPKGCDLLTYYTAVALRDYLVDVYDIKLDVKSDREVETVYEILIGNTNRILDVDVKVELGENQYILFKDEAKVVMLGNSYMIAGGASALLNKYMAGVSAGNTVDITTLPRTAQVETFAWETPKSVIYMIGDGMGQNHIEATKELRDMPEFFAEQFPYITNIQTYSYSVLPLRETDATDSAAAGTALATGWKTLNSHLGVDIDSEPIQNIRELARSKGAKTAVLTTDAITGATPSAFICHHNSRFDTDILQEQIDTVVANGEIDFCWGDGDTDELTDLAREALSVISKDGDPFFIMIEEAHIDKESHNQNMSTMPDKVVRFNDCISYCTVFAVMRPDTMVIVTADHETGFLKKASGIWDFNKAYHSNSVVPLFVLGYEGITELIGTGRHIDNTAIPKFIAKVLYGVEDFGDQNFKK